MKLNKDFYADLPGMVCVQIEDYIIPRFQDREWFRTFWEEYRQHVLNSDVDNMMMPAHFLKKYVDLDTLKDIEG